MWLDTNAQSASPSTQGAADLIQMDTASIRTGAATVVGQVIRGADAMGIHFNNLGTTAASTCLCDLWDSSIPGFTEEVGALGNAVLESFNGWLSAFVDATTRANKLDADQAQASAVTGVGGGVDAGFGGLLASAIAADANNRAIATWLDAPMGTSQVDILLATQGMGTGFVGGGLGGGIGGLGLGPGADIINTSNDNAIKTWLAPDGTSYIGADDSGRDQYKDRSGDIGTLSQMHRDTRDENNNGSTSDTDID